MLALSTSIFIKLTGKLDGKMKETNETLVKKAENNTFITISQI